MKYNKVMKAPTQQVPWDSPYISYPMLASRKLDGYRCLLKKGQLLTPTMREQPNQQLWYKWADLRRWAMDGGWVIDGEIWSPNYTFSQLGSIIRSHSHLVPSCVQFHVFDMLSDLEWEHANTEPLFGERIVRFRETLKPYEGYDKPVRVIDQKLVNTADDAQALYEAWLKNGDEGLILRCPVSGYKHGRATHREGTSFKFKEFVTLDVTIVGFTQRRQMAEDVRDGHRERDGTGATKRTHRQDDYELVDEIGATVVQLEGGSTCKVSCARDFDLGAHGCTWATKDQFIGRTVEIRYMQVGMKDVPRMGAITRFRPDKD